MENRGRRPFDGSDQAEERRRPSVKQKEQAECLELLACTRYHIAKATRLSRENCSGCEMDEQRDIEQCGEKVAALQRKLAVKGNTSTQSGIGEEENERPGVLDKQDSMQVPALKQVKRRPSKKRNMELDLTLGKTSTQSGIGEEENERPGVLDKQDSMQVPALKQVKRRPSKKRNMELDLTLGKTSTQSGIGEEENERPGVLDKQDSMQVPALKQVKRRPSKKRNMELDLTLGKTSTQSGIGEEENERPGVLDKQDSMQVPALKQVKRRPSKKRNMELDLTLGKTSTQSGIGEEENERPGVLDKQDSMQVPALKQVKRRPSKKRNMELGLTLGKTSTHSGIGEEENERPGVLDKQDSMQVPALKRGRGRPPKKPIMTLDLTIGKTSTRSEIGEEENERPGVLDKQDSMQVPALKQGRGRRSKKRIMALDLTIGKTSTQSGSREEENEWEEGNEWQEENQCRFVEALQTITPRRCCGLPLMEQMLEENEWRIKAKAFEGKCSEVTKELEELRGAITLDMLPLLAPCKCHFFKSANTESQTTYDDYVSQSSVQTFLRNVRLLRRLKLQRIGDIYDEVQGHLAMMTDFVVELSSQSIPIYLKGRNSDAYVHHAVDFIKDTLPLLREGNEEKRAIVDNLVAKLVLDLVGKLLNFTPDLNSTPDQESAQGGIDDKDMILIIMLRLAEYAYIGHRMLLTSSQQIAMVLERLQCMDPFDEGFSQIHENLFFMFHLVETLVAAHMASWRKENNLGQGILEEWVTCHFQCRTTLERRPTAWTPQFMIVLDSITEKLLEQLHCSAELEGQDIWQKALAHLLASAASAVTRI